MIETTAVFAEDDMTITVLIYLRMYRIQVNEGGNNFSIIRGASDET